MFSSRHTPSGNDKNKPIPESHRSALLRDAARRRIGQLLRAAGRISQDELDQALAIQKKQGGEIIGMVWKALIAGFLATCMTAALVGAMPRELFHH